MKKCNMLAVVVIILMIVMGCAGNKENSKIASIATDTDYSDNLNDVLIFDTPIYFDIGQEEKIHQWAFANDGTFSYFVNDIESWGNDTPKSVINSDISRAEEIIISSQGETIIAVIDTAFSFRYFSVSDSLWENSDEIANDNIDNDNNGYIDDINGYNFQDNNNLVNNNGLHGTAILGLLCAKPEISGFNNIIDDYNIKVMCVKALDDNSETAKIPDIIDSIKYAEANGAVVCCLSFGTFVYNQEFEETIKKSKMLFVVASGNDGYDIDNELPFYPASFNEDNIITVASMRCDGKIDCTSNYGKYSVDLVAPGTDLVSITSSGNFAYFCGTSYAVPFVGGVAAKIFNLNNNDISASQVGKIILESVKESSDLDDYVKTSGMLNEKAAIEGSINYYN